MISFTSAFNWSDGINAYYELDETTGDVIDATRLNDGTNSGSTRGVNGKLPTINPKAFSFDGTNDNIETTCTDWGSEVSISMWVNFNSTTDSKRIISKGSVFNIYPQNNHIAGDIAGAGGGGYSVVEGTTVININTWYHVVATFSEDTFKIYLNGTLEDTDTDTLALTANTDEWIIGANIGVTQYHEGYIDEVGIWDRELTPTDVSELYNSFSGLPYLGSNLIVDLYFPPEDVLLSDQGLSFIANYTVNGLNLTNATYYVWKNNGVTYDVFNITTNTTFTANSTSQYINNFTLGEYKWNVFACAETIGSDICEWSIQNYTFEIGANINSETYNSETYETTDETYEINITLLAGVILYEAILNYDGVEYIGSFTNIGNNSYYLTRTINVPNVEVDSNLEFYWTFRYDAGGSVTQNSTTHNQSVLNLPLIVITDGSCGVGMVSSMYYNFTNSENLTAINSDIAYNFQFGITNLSTMVVSGSFSNKSSFRICINSTIDNYRLGYGEIEYSLDSYTTRRYYMYEEQLLSNTIQSNHTLSLLPSVDSTSFIFEFKNTFLNPYTDKLVMLLRWYPSIDEYKIVEMGKTDDDGKTVMKVHTEDVDYRVGLYYLNGSLIKLAEPVRMACLVDPCTYTLKVIHDPVDFSVIYDIESLLTWDEDNDRFIYIFNDPNQITSQMRLHVYKDAGFQEILICNDTATGYTGVLTCSIGNYTGTLVARVYRSASPEWAITSLYHSIRTGVESSFGLFASFLIVLTSALIGIFSPIASIMLLILGLIPAVFLGSISFAVFMGIGVLGGIIINVIKNYS